MQDAHEAIRPSYIEFEPETLKESLTKDQYNLYKLIWSRFMASQMKPAVYNTVSAEIDNNGYGFRANGSNFLDDTEQIERLMMKMRAKCCRSLQGISLYRKQLQESRTSHSRLRDLQRQAL